MKIKKPEFGRVSQLQERTLYGQLLAARELISHPAEKGRSLEREVATVLRAMLPSEYGVGTGFIAYHGARGPELSPQLDIIVYDAVRSGPIGRLAACEVYPIEGVFGYVEVKASIAFKKTRARKLPHNSLQRCMKQNHLLRKIKTRHFWDTSYSGSPMSTSLVSVDDWLSLRAFVFAFEGEGAMANDPEQFASSMADYAKQFHAHLHGVLILDRAYLTTIPVDVQRADPGDYYHISYTTEHPFAAFRLHLLKALGTFQRPYSNWIPALETYFELPRNWKTAKPSA